MTLELKQLLIGFGLIVTRLAITLGVIILVTHIP